MLCFCILKDLEAHFEDYSTLLGAVDQLLDEAETKLPEAVDLDSAPSTELAAEHNKAQVCKFIGVVCCCLKYRIYLSCHCI